MHEDMFSAAGGMIGASSMLFLSLGMPPSMENSFMAAFGVFSGAAVGSISGRLMHMKHAGPFVPNEDLTELKQLLSPAVPTVPVVPNQV